MTCEQQIILFFWSAHHLRSTGCLQSNCLLLFCFLSSSFLKVTGSQRSKVKLYICVYLSGSEFRFLVTFTFVRPNILDSFVNKRSWKSFYKFVAPVQLVSSVSLPWHRFIRLAISKTHNLKFYPPCWLWAAYCAEI